MHTNALADFSVHCGAATVDITPDGAVSMAGYSLDGHVGHSNDEERLLARAIYFANPDGGAVAFCFVDLWSASGYLFHAASNLLRGRGSPVSASQLVIAGTHTHLGPGRYMGNGFYDTFAQSRPGFRRAVAEKLALGIADAVTAAVSQARPASVSVGEGSLWGVGRNRSMEPFLANFGSGTLAEWLAAGSPGHGAPTGLSPAQQAIDPRLRVVSAFDGNNEVIASFILCALHATSLGNFGTSFRQDWPRFAIEEARQQLSANSQAVFAVGNCAAGDVTPLPLPPGPPANPPEPNRNPPVQGEALATSVGHKMGAKWAEIAMQAPRATTLEVRSRLGMWAPLDGDEDAPEDAKITGWAIGCPAIGGAEDYRSKQYGNGWLKSREGLTGNDFPADDPRHPMVPALGFLQGWLKALCAKLAPAEEHPLHVVSLGALVIATVPGEPTSNAAFTLERHLFDAIRSADPHADVERIAILGYAGDYAGYFTTRSEYVLQHYEGASTIYGRNSLMNLALALERVVSGGTTNAPLKLSSLNLMSHAELRAAWASALQSSRVEQGVRVASGHGKMLVTFAETLEKVAPAGRPEVKVRLSANDQARPRVAVPRDVSPIRGLSPRELRLWVVEVERGPGALAPDAVSVELEDGTRWSSTRKGVSADISPTRRPTRPKKPRR